MREIKLTPGPGGWLHADWVEGKAWVRFAHDKRKRLHRIAEIHVSDPTAELLRRVPLNRIHAAATMRGAGAIQLALALRINEPVPADLFAKPPKGGAVLERRYQLVRPAGKALGDQFYRDVAHAYQSAVAFGLNPRKAIVIDTGAADATVAAWVMGARKRGHLPPATRGKVTA